MIDARELRIGNWVFDDENNLCQISSLMSEKKAYNEGCETQFDTDGICVEYPNMEANYITENINPIPLTAERLERFGFEKSGEYHTMLVGDLISSIYFVVDGVDFSIAIADSISSYEDGSRYLTPELKATRNVHQLQNLYFALTGEELELKTESK